MAKLAFLTTYFPWPPDTGTRIRNWQMLRFLATRWEVHLLVITAQEGVPDDREWRVELAGVEVFDLRREIPRGVAYLGARLSQFLRLRPCLYLPGLRQRIAAALRRTAPEVLLAVGTASAQFVDLDDKLPGMRYFFDEAGADHLRIRSAMALEKNPLRRLRQGGDFWRLRRYERQLGAAADGLLAVSPHEAAYLRRLVGDTEVVLVPCGANLDLFEFHYAGDENRTLMFCGDLHYGPNEDAVVYFLEEIFPAIVARFPEVRFKVVGRFQGSRLPTAVARFPQAELVGYAEDLNPQWRQASIFVNPMRQGRGFITKILDAFTAGLAVVSTNFLIGDLGIVPGRHFLEAGEAGEFARAVCLLLENPQRKRGLIEAGRAYAEEHDWERSLRPLAEVLSAGGGGKG